MKISKKNMIGDSWRKNRAATGMGGQAGTLQATGAVVTGALPNPTPRDLQGTAADKIAAQGSVVGMTGPTMTVIRSTRRDESLLKLIQT